jgi:hypothetical protein
LRFFSASSKRWLTTIIQKNGQTSDPTTLSAHTNMTEFDDSFSILWENDVDPAKVTLGLAFYGRSYTLKDASCSSPGCAIFGFGPPGMCDDAYGYESYDQVQSLIDDKSTSTYFDEDAGVNIATYGGYQWMSFENKESFAKKVEYASAHCIGGEINWMTTTYRKLTVLQVLMFGELISIDKAMRSRRCPTARRSSKELQKRNPTLRIPCLSVIGLSVSTRHRLVPDEGWEVSLVDNLVKKAVLLVQLSLGERTVMVLVTRQASTGFSAAPTLADLTAARHGRTPRGSRRAA